MKNRLYYLLITIFCFLVLPSCNEEDNPIDETSDYLEVTLNGKTYREKIPNWGYSYFDATDKDSSGKPISVNNVIVDLYEKYGFSFFPMIAYYSKKTDLMAAKPGKYLHTLTSSTRTPKFIRKQWRNALMAFHQHSSVDYLLVLRQCNLYGHYSFSKFEHLVHTHIYA